MTSRGTKLVHTLFTCVHLNESAETQTLPLARALSQNANVWLCGLQPSSIGEHQQTDWAM